MEDETQPEIQEEKAVRLSLHLIVKRHLPPEAQKWDQEKMVQALNQITHLRLDREKIGEIDNLELLGEKVTNIYLQCNWISQIDNLECLKNLTFITLANNRIKVVENLLPLKKLVFLDLSENQISKIDAGELPQSILILNLKGNPCTDYPDYRYKLIHDMPKLTQLDLQQISRRQKQQVGLDVSSDEDIDDDDDDASDEDDDAGAAGGHRDNGHGDNGHGNNGHGLEESMQSLATKLMVRSQRRLEDSLKVHKRHTAELDDLRISWNVPQSSRSTTASSEVSRSLAKSTVTVDGSER